MNYHFEWDPVKAACNLKKHGVSFEEAVEIFIDPLQLSILDDANEGEERWVTLGSTKADKLRLVVHTFMVCHDQQITIRIISARRATRYEQKQYKEA
ncbi:MAG: BrnT family toxin [Mariprofundaceae bacterium]|nr:BrnT family toxin [Mariprofundaceae bacterium]